MSSAQSYVSVYVPEYQGHQPHQSPYAIKSKVITIRRCWNRLSRLQKSFLLMVAMMLLVISLVFTSLIWVPQPSDGIGNSINSNNFPSFNQNNQVPEEEVNSNLVKPSVVDIKKESNHLIQTTAKLSNHDRKWHVSSPKPVGMLPTIPRALQPDFSDNSQTVTKWGFKNLLNEKIAEDIRNVISLDPVIPIHPKKVLSSIPTKSSAKQIKFEGPKNERQKAVVDAFLHAWKGYKKFAWGRDHLRPISETGGDWFGLGLTIVDSLDTLYIMNLQREFNEARDWVEENLSFDNRSKNVNLFETTIRVLGGLLSAFHLSLEQIFIKKAQDLGSRLLSGFKSPSGIPYSDINLKTLRAAGPSWNPDSTTSEVSTLQIEFRDLSRLTNVTLFERTAMNVSYHIHRQQKFDGLVPIHISPNTGDFRMNSVITLGARGDSYYEYLLKQWIQTGQTIDFLKSDYLAAVEGIRNKLVKTTSNSNLTYVGELEQATKMFRPKMDHLVCYLPGTLALGNSVGLPDWHLELAKSLLRTCYETYKRQPTGLAPEITYFRMEDGKDTDFYVKHNDAHNLLRPEFVESLWYLHQLTGDKMYQEWGWEVFESFMKYTRVEHGFSSINSVLSVDDAKPRDMMESFFLAETLKYFYLLFSDQPIFNLNEWVFNTEAHPLPIYDH